MKKKIVVDIKNLALVGAGISGHFKPLLKYLITAKPDWQFYLIGPQADLEFLRHLNNWDWIEIRVPNKLPANLRLPLYDFLLFQRQCLKIKPDLIYCSYFDLFLWQDIPAVITVYDLCYLLLGDYYPTKYRIYYNFLLRHNLKKAHKIITCSYSSQQDIERLFPSAKGKVTTLYCVFDQLSQENLASLNEIQAWRRRFQVLNRKVILYAGGCEFRKNLTQLLAVLGLLLKHKQFQDCVLFITGDSASFFQYIQQDITDEIKNQLIFSGRMSDKDLNLAYQAAEVLIYPSLFEGFGRPLVEAQLWGTPVVCSDIAVFREIGGEHAIYCKEYDTQAFADAIAQVILHPKRQRLALKEEYTLANNGPKLIQLFDEINIA